MDEFLRNIKRYIKMLVLTLNKLHITPSCLINFTPDEVSVGFILMREVKVTEAGDIVYKNERDDILPTKAVVNESYCQSLISFFNNIISKLRVNLPNCSPETFDTCQQTVRDFTEIMLSNNCANQFLRLENITSYMSVIKAFLLYDLYRDTSLNNREQATRAFDDTIQDYQGHQVWVNF